MEKYEDPDSSLPFIDDSLTDDEVKNNYYNLKIIENYQNKNRNIEITNESPDDVMGSSLSPVAPLAEETEISDSRLSDSQEEEKCRHVKRKPVGKKSGMKLVVKGWNSTISIQGLDNKSSITFKRRSEKIQHEKFVRSLVKKEKEIETQTQMEKPVVEKSRKGRWKLLTKSLISKTSRLERRGLDERYPKYVLLKNEEELGGNEKESYPKMVVLDKNKPGGKEEKENLENKSEFNFKRSFKNKTKPIVPIEEILPKSGKGDLKKEIRKKEKIPLTERSHSENRNVMFKKRVIVERRKSFASPQIKQTKSKNEQEMTFDRPPPPPQAQVFKEIKDIFEDTLKLCSDVKQPEEGKRQDEPQYCQFSCHDPCCFAAVHEHQPPMYVPVYPPYGKPNHFYKNSNTQTNEGDFGNEKSLRGSGEEEISFQTLPFSLLSNFFPRVVIMKTFDEGNLGGDATEEQNTKQKAGKENAVEDSEDKVKTPSTLEVPEQDLALKSKMVVDESNFEPEVDPFYTSDIYVNCLTLNGMCSFDEEQKPKTDDSEATEYLHYCESENPGNESTKPTFTWETSSENNITKTAESKSEKGEEGESEENGKNYTLTKVGYKMYDNLTKLSLKRETEIVEKPETGGCGCTGNGTKKSPYNITLESNNGVVKVTVPENELNLKFVNSGTADIQIGVSNPSGEKKVVRKSELWHSDNGQRQLVLAGEKKMEVIDGAKGAQKISLSLGDNKDVVLSIEMKEKEQKEDKIKEIMTKEVKVGTDDFHLAGGDFSCTLGGNYKNLSPRTGQLLKNLQQRLEFGEKERKFLQSKINEKLTDHKFNAGILPGIFLVKQISPRPNIPLKKPLPWIKVHRQISVSSEIYRSHSQMLFHNEEKQGHLNPDFLNRKSSSLKKEEKVEEVKNIREYYCEECLATLRIFEDENPSVKRIVDKFETIIQLESF